MSEENGMHNEGEEQYSDADWKRVLKNLGLAPNDVIVSNESVPGREISILKDDVINLRIMLNTTASVGEFLHELERV